LAYSISFSVTISHEYRMYIWNEKMFSRRALWVKDVAAHRF
jgi:hypothetical protein